MKMKFNLYRRVMAMLLTLCMFTSTLAGYVPTWFAAFAEEDAGEESSGYGDDSGSDGSSDSDTSHDSDSSSDSDTSHDSDSTSDSDTSHDSDSTSDSDTSHDSDSTSDSDTSHDSDSTSDSDTSHDSDSTSDSDTSHDSDSTSDSDMSYDSDSESEGNAVTVVWGDTDSGESESDSSDEGDEAPVVWGASDAGESEPESSDEGDEAPVIWNDSDSVEPEPAPSDEAGTVPDAAEPGDLESELSPVPEEITVILGTSEPEEAPETVSDASVDAQPEADPAIEENTDDSGAPADEAGSPAFVVPDNAVSEEPEPSLEAPVSEIATVIGEDVSDPADVHDTAVEGTATDIVGAPEAAAQPVMMAADDAKDDPSVTKKPFLQDMIDEALIKIKSTLNERVEIILSRNMKYEGDITITAGDREVGENFEVALIADDAGDNGNAGAGYTTIAGDVTIKGIKVVMHSIMLDGKNRISVQNRNDTTVDKYKTQGGALEYVGTTNLANTVNVSVGVGSEATISIADNDNELDVETAVGAKALNVIMGGGVDKIKARIYGGDVNLDMGGGTNTVNLDVEGSKVGDVTVSTGSGIDELTLVDNGGAKSFKVSTGGDDDTINIDVRENGGSLDVDVGDGADTVNIAKGNHHTLESMYTDQIINVNEEANQASAAMVNLTGTGQGDRVSINASTALAVKGVNIQGEGASVFLFGDLAQLDDPITWVDPEDHSKGFRLHTWLETEGMALSNQQVDYTLDILGSSQNVYTDALNNKRTVELDNPTSGIYFYAGARRDFTNYVLKNQVSDLDIITVKGASAPLTLSNVVLDASITGEDDDHIKLNNVSVENLNLLVKGDEIDLNGKISAENVVAQSIQGSKRIGEAMANIGSVPFGETMSNIVNIEHAAVINVNGTVTAEKDLSLTASVRQFGSALSFLPTFLNVLNIKLADAEININKGAQLIAGHNVTAVARTAATAGFDYKLVEENGQQVAKLEKYGMPLAVTWIMHSAQVKVAKGASVSGGTDVALESSGTVKVANFAESSTIPSPVDIALTVITNDISTRIDGTVSSGGRARFSSSGIVEDQTLATGSVGASSLGGAFVAVNVVDQNVETVVGKTAHIDAAGGVQVNTNAVARVDVSAISAEADVTEFMPFAAALAETATIAGSALWAVVGSWIVGGMKTAGSWLYENALKYNKKWFGGKDAQDSRVDKILKKIEKLSKSVKDSNYSVKVVDLDSLNAGMGTASATTGDDPDGSGRTIVTVKPSPRSGCSVKRIRYRYLKEGEDHYTYMDAPYKSGEDCTFEMPPYDVEVIVTYSGNPDGKDAEAGDAQGQKKEGEGAFMNIGNLMDDAAGGAAGNPEDDDDFQIEGDGSEIVHPCQLVFDPATTGGKVVTWLTGDDDLSISTVYTNRNVRLVPNPDKGKQLESLNVVYTIVEDDAEIIEQIQVAADELGRYIFKVPENIKEGTELNVQATFADKAGTEEQTQSNALTGALAVNVVNSDNKSIIEDGAYVSAGGTVSLYGFKINAVTTTADGSPIKKKDAATIAKEKEQYQPSIQSGYSVGGAEYALKLNSNVSGLVKGAVGYKQTGGATAYHPIFSMDAESEKHLEKMVISYYSKIETNAVSYFADTGAGTRRTIELVKQADGSYKVEGNAIDKLLDCFDVKHDKNGNLSITANMTGLGILQGTTADVSFIFDDTAKPGKAGESDGETVTAVAGESVYLIRNPIQVKYNILRDKDNYADIRTLGKLTFSRKTTDDKGSTRYYFNVAAETNKGYTIHPLNGSDATQTTSDTEALYASWIGTDGLVHKAPLRRNHEIIGTAEWYIEPGFTIPEGAVISVNAVFTEDKRDVVIKQEKKDQEKGTASASVKSAKHTDKVEVKLNPKDGYAATGIEVRYSDKFGMETKLDPRAIHYNTATGKYEFLMPMTSDAKGSSLRITPVFAAKDVEIVITAAKGKGEQQKGLVKIADSTGKAARGETISIMPTDEVRKEGYKLASVTIKVGEETRKYEADFDKITLPANIEGNKLEITSELKKGVIPIAEFTDAKTECKAGAVYGTADPGEKVIVKAETATGFRVKKGSLKAKIVTSTGTQQIVLKREKDGNYSFVIPPDADNKTRVSLSCEFEPGSDGPAYSAGVGLAVTVSSSDSESTVEGGTIRAGKGISAMSLAIASKAGTTAKAGYSKGDIGVGGAVSVQVAHVNSDVAIKKSDKGSIAIGQGNIFLSTNVKNNFNVTADASGGKKGNATSGSTGVGAGIAFAVDHMESISEVEDGVKLVKYDPDPAVSGDERNPLITGLTVSAGQKAKDEITAKAGAAGGSAWVPVAAVDINTSDVRAYMGKLDLSALTKGLDKDLTEEEELLKKGYLPVAGGVKVKANYGAAKVEYNHVITADAAASGAAAAVGGAFIVNWINTDAKARLNQSVHTTGAVNVTSSSGDAVKAVATASVNGGATGTNKDKDEDKDKGKDGAVDQKANQLLNGGAKVAQQQGQNGNAIMNDAQNRQKSESAENTVSVAGAFALNMQKNKSRAEILDGVNITAVKAPVTVKSQNRTEAYVKANASSTKSDVGVGVGVAINWVRMENIARIGNGDISAAKLEVIAEMAPVPPAVGTRTVVLNASSFKSQMQMDMEEALKSIMPDNFFGDTLSEVVSALAANFYDKLVTDFNLQQLLNIANDGNVLSRFENAGKILLKRLEEFPLKLVSPFTAVYSEMDEIVQNTEALGWEQWEDLLTDALKTATVEALGDGDQIVKNMIRDNYMSLAGGLIHMVNAKISGKGWDTKVLTDTMKSATTKAMKDFTDKLIDTVVNKMNDKLPVLSQSNIELTRKLIDELKSKTGEEIVEDFFKEITTTLRTEVYDYEPILAKVTQDGLTKFIKDEITAALKQGTTAATNALINKVVGKANATFAREINSGRHTITTQAISGAGAKGSSGAGSLALAVADLDTKAEIADSAYGVSVDEGNLIVKAEEARITRTHATAAVDENGEADNNEGEDEAENAETGGTEAGKKTIKSDKNSATRGVVTVTTGVGGIAEFSDSDEGRVYLDVADGYKLADGDVIRSYTNSEGVEVVDKLEIEKFGDDYIVHPTEGLDIDFDELTEEELKNLHINIDVSFRDNLHGLPVKPGVVTAGGKQVLDEALSFTCKDREVKDGKLQASNHDIVTLTVDYTAARGSVLDKLVYSYTDDFGFKHTETVNAADIVGATNVVQSEYNFKMPDGEVDSFTLHFKEGNHQDEVASESDAKDGAGRSVGVGAAVAFVWGNSDVKAVIGKRDQGVTAGSIAVTASSEHEAEDYATAGTDPFEGTDEDNEKETGADAAVAVEMLDNNITAEIAEGTAVTTTAEPGEDDPAISIEESDEDEDEGEDDDDVSYVLTPGALIIHATESAATDMRSSSFATGSTTAVGVTVAVNIALSDVRAKLGSGANVTGSTIVRAYSKSEDETYAFASALGASVQRSLNKLAGFVEQGDDVMNNLTTGKYFDKKAKDDKSKKKSTDTSKKITDRLNNDKVKQEGGSEASENLPVSANVARSQDVKMDNGGDELQEAKREGEQQAQKEGKSNAVGQDHEKNEDKLQVAATLGVTVALHDAAVTVGGPINSGRAISLTAQNAGNFATRATAAAMNTGIVSGGSTIAVAVGLSVNNNKATVDVKDDVKAGEDVEISADLTQNMSGKYPGRLAVQVLSGSVSAKGTDNSVAGAVGVLVSHGTSRAKVIGAKEITGDTVLVSATDKSKLSVRSGGVNISKGTNQGAGISVAAIWAGNRVEAEVSNGTKGTTVTANSFDVIAKKRPVSWSDFVFPLSWGNLVSDSSALDDEGRENVDPGLFDVHKKPGETSYKVDVNLNTWNLMNLPDLFNFLSAKNYYVESIAGSVVSGVGDNDSNLAGSVSVVRASNVINAALGQRVTVKPRDEEAEEGHVNLEAQGASNVRLLGGSLAAGGAKNANGVVITFLYDRDNVTSTVGNSADITSVGSFTNHVNADTSVQTFNAAAAVNTASNGENTRGGAINVVVLKNNANARLGNANKITAKGGGLAIEADADMDLTLVSVGVAGAGKSSAMGGTLAMIFDRAGSTVDVGRSHRLKARDDVVISAMTKDHMTSAIASASVAASGEKSYAGAINVISSNAKGKVTLAASSTGEDIVSEQGSVLLRGETQSRAINVTASGAGSKGKAVGASINLNIFNRDSAVNVAGGARNKITAAKDVLMSSYGRDINVLGALAVAGSAKENAISGNIALIVSRNNVTTDAKLSTIQAGGEAAFASRLKDDTYAIAGSIAVTAGSKTGFGGTAMVVTKQNTVRTDLGTSTVTAAGSAGTLSEKLHDNPGFKGIYVGSTVKNTLVTAAAGMAMSGDKGVTVNLVSSANINQVKADASKATLKAIETDKKGNVIGGGSIRVDARDKTRQTLISGGVNVGKNTGVGAGVSVLVSKKNVEALAHDLHAYENVDVKGSSDDDIFQFNVNAGGSGKTAVELGISFQIIKSKVNAAVASAVTAEKGGFSLKADNNTDMTNASVALAGSGKTAVTPVVVVTIFGGETNALLGAGTVKAAKNVVIEANSDKTLDQYTIGAAAGGKAAASGAFSVATIKDTTNAAVADGVDITGNKLRVEAQSDYTMNGVSAAVGVAGKGAGVINVLVNVMKGNTLAEMGGKANLNGKATVRAKSDRDVTNGVISVGGGGQGGVGVTVMVLAVGEKLDQDAADMMTYGNITEKDDENKAVDTDALVAKFDELGLDTSDLVEKRDADGNVTQTGLTGDLEGNGNSNHENMSVGDGEQVDVASGYSDQNRFKGPGEKAEGEEKTAKAYEGKSGSTPKKDETDDIKKSKKIGDTVYSESPKDAVVARIGSNAEIHSVGVTVDAKQKTTADLFGMTAGIGGTGGGSISVAVATLRSNVFATSLGDLDVGEGDVVVRARSSGGNVTPDSSDDENNRNEVVRAELGDKLNLTKRSIRVIGLGIGGGSTVGVAMSAAAARLDNITNATLGGTITNAGNVSVDGTAKYDNVLAATLAGSGSGGAALAASVAVALANGDVAARIDETADISLTARPVYDADAEEMVTGQKVSVTTDSVMNASAYGIAAGVAAYGAVTTTITVAKNNLTQNTSVARGAAIRSSDGSGVLDVKGKSDSTANTGMLGVTAAIGALGVGVSVANVKPTINTTVGYVGEEGETTLEKMDAVTIANQATSSGDATMISAAGGGVAVTTNVMLVYNDTDATAMAANLAGSMNTLSIEGDLGAKGNALIGAGIAAVGAIGVSVDHVDVNASNRALLDADNMTAAIKTLNVRAGKDDKRFATETSALGVAASLGGTNIGVNTAVARNRARNIASIYGSGDLKADVVNLDAYSKSNADSAIYGLAIGVCNIGVSVVDTLNESTSMATMNLGGALEGKLNVTSHADGSTDSKLVTGEGSIVGVKVSSASSYGQLNSLIDVELGKAPEGKTSINASNTGSDRVNNDISNLIGLSGIAIATMSGEAYSQDRYDTHVKLAGGDYKLEDLSLSTDTTNKTVSYVTPSASGVDVNGLSITVNKANAESTAYTGAMLELENATAVVDKDVNVIVRGAHATDAQIQPALFTLSGTVDIGVNKATSDLAATQVADILVKNGTLEATGEMNVRSLVGKAETNAVVSSSGINEEENNRTKLGVFAVDSSEASAIEDLAATASIRGEGTPAENIVKAASLTMTSGVGEKVQTESVAKTYGSRNVGVVTVGNLDGKATSSDSFNTMIDGVHADITGKADLKAETNTNAKGDGKMPGSWSIVGVGVSTMKARVGSSGNRETAKVLIGSDTGLAADTVNIEAINRGEATAKVARGTAVSIVSVGVSNQPTESWYDTGVSIGDRASITARKELIEADWADEELKGKYALNIDARSHSKGTSKVDATQVGLGFNLNHMKGENTIHEENNIDIGTAANLWAKGSMNISNASSVEAEGITDLNGGGLIDGTAAFADNAIYRYMRLNVGDSTHLTSDVGSINLKTISGAEDKIVTKSLINNGGAIAVGNGVATTKLTSENQINIGNEAELSSYGDINVNAIATSHQADGEKGIETVCDIDTGGIILIPNADADVVMKLTTYINLNRKGQNTTQLKTNGAEPVAGDINISVSSEGLNVKAEGNALVAGGGGGSDAEADITANIMNTIWVDSANLMAQGIVNLRADNRGAGDTPLIHSRAKSELFGVAGDCDADAYLRGVPYNQIKSTNTRNVRVTATDFTHEAVSPYEDIDQRIEDIRRHSPPPLIVVTGGASHNDWKDSARHRCDFCAKGTSTTVTSVTERDTHSAMASARKKALAPISTLNKTLSTLRDIRRNIIEEARVFRAWVDWDTDKAAGAIFDLNRQTILTSNMLLTKEQASQYLLWNNIDIFHDVYLLPNATRLYTIGDMILQYVAEVLQGDIRGNGMVYDIDIIVPLTRYASIKPIIPIGSAGSLSLDKRELSLPAQARFELYLHEISGAWLLEKLNSGFIRRLNRGKTPVSVDEIGTNLATGATIIQTTNEDSEGLPANLRRFWLADSPSNVSDPDQPLFYILINEQTDEVDAFRTSVNMIARGEAPVDVSIWLFRDLKADRMGREKYNAVFYDTPAGTLSKLVLYTDLIDGQTLVVPRTMQIVLRAFWLGRSADMPACSILDHFYALRNPENGVVSAFDGEYKAIIDSNTFESDYTLIEGLLDDELNITIKAGQPVWQVLQSTEMAE